MIDISNLPLDVTLHIAKFRNFLIHSWNDLDILMESHDWHDDGLFIDDWVQSCWEYLVQRELLGNTNASLTPFAICPQNPGKTSYNIQVISKLGETVYDPKKNKHVNLSENLRLFGFIGMGEDMYGLHPPFNIVCLYDEKNKLTYHVSFDDVKFILNECKYLDSAND